MARIKKKAGSIDFEDAKKALKEKTIVFSLWNCESPSGWTNYQFYGPLKEIFKEVIVYDPRKRRFMYGPEGMKRNFLRLIKEKKPDYVFMQVGSDEINLDTIEEINRISPQSKTIGLFTDDDTDFDIFTRYYALFLDYCMASQPKYMDIYYRDGLENAFPMMGTNMDLFKPTEGEKKYDVSFVGQYYPPRAEMAKFLIANGIDLKIWGNSKWLIHPELRKAFQGGPIAVDEYIKVMSQSKITLGLVRNQYGSIHISHRPFEAAGTKAFQILDYAPEYWDHLKKDKEVVMFRYKEDLLKKIKYYLSHEKEREEITERAYRRVTERYSIKTQLIKFFSNVLAEEGSFKRRDFPKIDKISTELSKDDFNRGNEHIMNKIKIADYISFSEGKVKKHKHKDYLQMYSLEKTGKDISCCDYALYSDTIGVYMVSKPSRYFKFMKKNDFDKIVNVNQLMVNKEFFLSNMNKFESIMNGGIADIITEENCAFIDIPLIRTKKLSRINHETLLSIDKYSMEKAFQLNFIYQLYSLFYRKKILDPYPFKMLLSSMVYRRFILRYMIQSLFRKDYLNRILGKSG